MKIIHNDSSSNDEIVSILRGIADEMEGSRNLRNDVKDRWNK